MDITAEMIDGAAKALQKAYGSMSALVAREKATIALEGALGDTSPTSLFFLGPFIKKSHLILIIPEDQWGGVMYRPVPGDEDKVERVGDWHIDVSFSKPSDGEKRITAFRVTKIPPRTSPEE